MSKLLNRKIEQLSKVKYKFESLMGECSSVMCDEFDLDADEWCITCVDGDGIVVHQIARSDVYTLSEAFQSFKEGEKEHPKGGI